MFLVQELRWLERLKQEHPSTTILALSKGRGGLCVLLLHSQTRWKQPGSCLQVVRGAVDLSQSLPSIPSLHQHRNIRVSSPPWEPSV